MDQARARHVLGIDNVTHVTPELLKRHYRIKALRYHPDKNASPDANEQFQLVREAYEYLSDHNSPMDNLSYVDMLKEFLNAKSPIIHIIISKLSHMCEDKAVRFINSIDKLILMDIYKLLIANREILYIPEVFIEEIRKILITKTQGDERILLNPSLDDLCNDNLYKLVVGDRTYLIPLWHHELIYDNSGCDLYVKCNPILPDNVEIDEDNNVIVSLEYSIADLLKMDEVYTVIGQRAFSFRTDELRVMKRQRIVRSGMGISRIKPKNIYDVSSRGDIIFDITLS
ncbi:MAG: J domain-containing protein [Flavobacterium sp.]